jgi:hypothetical protein
VGKNAPNNLETHSRHTAFLPERITRHNPFSEWSKWDPLAYALRAKAIADPKPFMVALAICISTSFCTPVAHETTMLVMGPGRYRFKHYLSIGSGMAVIAWLLTTFVTPLGWRF